MDPISQLRVNNSEGRAAPVYANDNISNIGFVHALLPRARSMADYSLFFLFLGERPHPSLSFSLPDVV